MPEKYYEFFCPVKILSGRKALPNLPYELTQLGSSKPLIITDKGVVGAKLINKVKSAFADSDIEMGPIYDDVPPDSGNRVVNTIAGIYRQEGCDAIVAVGGGSVIDTAKGVNIVVSESSDDLLKFQGVDRVTADMQPFIVIPTTAGTGSEVTAAAVIINQETNTKMAFMSNKLYPDVALVDTAMMLTMPPKITAATGMDALTHACEAFYCLGKNPVSDAFASSAIKLTMKHLATAVEHGDDEEARLGMANAALLAGIAFSNSMVGIVHAMAHATGGVAHVPHGVANAIYLSYGMEYNISKVPDDLAELAVLLGAPEHYSSAEAQASKGVQIVRDLVQQLNGLCELPTNLREAGVQESQLDDIAKGAINDGSLTYNPREADQNDVLEILKKAF